MPLESLTLAGGTAITVLLLTTGHWMPWQLSRIQAYAYGTAAIMAGFAVWRIPLGDWRTPLGLLLLAVAGGVTVTLAYQTDHITREVREARMRRSVDDTSGE